MTLWNIIRDFFVQYIFGGVDSNEVLYSFVCGKTIGFKGGVYEEEYLTGFNDLYAFSYTTGDGYTYYLGMSDWLSTTATIITLCAICVFLFFFVRWLFRLTAGLISGRG